MVAYERSICKVPLSLLIHDLDKRIPNLGGTSATTLSMTTLFIGNWNKETSRPLITMRLFTFLESNEYRSW
jgi:hypothetical protein